MTDNPNRQPFSAMSRKDQDRIAGAIARGDAVEWHFCDGWEKWAYDFVNYTVAYRFPRKAKPAKDPNRPRQAHKLNLKPGDVVMVYEIEDLVEADACGEIICLGETDTRGDWIMDRVRGRSGWLQWCIENPQEKGHRALFAVVSRAKGE